ncbi:putative enzyme related to lactoylglutathione lyase [Clavibacter michiganensis]|uniref:VOC family protein n=1 Tax=Clavibacter michiganensis TaxID=28447 RepID=UPI001956C7E9|nr:VOC family protein [Clavibacter michiganensis]MBM7412341.1 putative enzyme related to lactoylglutathione lyase [Clavibacter michiganensis]
MVKDLTAVWVPVTDMKRATAFYRDVLGLTITSESDTWSEIETSGVVIGLNARENAAVSEHGGAVLSFEPDGSIEDEVAAMNEKGAGITPEISEKPFGRIMPFKDSEGNDLQLVTAQE